MEDEHRGTYCTWCGKPGGFMWTTLGQSNKQPEVFVTIGGTVHWPCKDPWLAWFCQQHALRQKQET
jgi:hypothetical protein